MRRTREEKAITLIALIITIVVLLILALVAINAVTGDGIIQHASNAKTAYENEQAKEEDILSYYQEYLNAEGNLGPWKQVGDNITMEDAEGNSIEIPIGAKVNYTPEIGKTYTSYSSKTGMEGNQTFTTTNEDLEWIVIGLENKKVMLMASKGVVPDGETKYCLNGAEGYNNGIQELNNISSIYMNSKYTEKARSLNEEDIDKMAGLTEEIKKSETDKHHDEILGSGVVEYNQKYIYNYDGDKLTFAKNAGEKREITEQTIIYFPDGVRLGKQGLIGKKEVESNWPSIYIASRMNSNIKTKIEVSNKWIASRGIQLFNETVDEINKGFINWGFKALGIVDGEITLSAKKMYDSKEGTAENLGKNTVCPLVVLKADVTLTKVADGVYDIAK